MQIELYSKLQNANDIVTMGMALGKSGIFGNDRQEFGIVALMTCAQESISPVQFTRIYDVISGKVKKKAMAAFAEFRAKGGKVKWLKTGDDGIEASAEITFEGQTVTLNFTIDQAKKQGLVRPGGNWDKTPGNMLRARLLSNAIGMLAPEIYAGDVEDSDTTPNTAQEPLLPPRDLKPQAEVINVESEVVPPKPAEVKPVEPVAQPTQPATAPKISSVNNDPATGRLTAESVATLQAAIGEENAATAIEWLKAKRWIKSNLFELSEQRARSIVERRDEFIKMIKANGLANASQPAKSEKLPGENLLRK